MAGTFPSNIKNVATPHRGDQAELVLSVVRLT